MMEFFAEHYGRRNAPNTRETVRRQTVHQLLEAGLVIQNPDDPARPVNSPRAVYQIQAKALQVLQSLGSPEWEIRIQRYLPSLAEARKKLTRERELQRIPVRLSGSNEVTLSPGGQNVLVKMIVEEFGARFVPGGDVMYVGDTEDKFAFFDADGLKALGLDLDPHGKVPDVVIYQPSRNWLFLIEAVTSHGPVSELRHRQLQTLFALCKAGLIFVTAFLTRSDLAKYLSEISWETEVWVAESPNHLIHFDGERFLGPYESPA